MNKWHKRTISFLLLFSILVSLLSTWAFAAPTSAVAPTGSSSTPITWHDASRNAGTAQNTFQDVKSTDWFYDAVMYVLQNDIFTGTGQDTFSPKSTMTRAMYVTVLGRIAGVDAGKFTTSVFTDVPLTAWYAPYVQWAVEKGITSGTGGDTFSPNKTLSREMMVTLTLRYFENENIAYQTNVKVTTLPSDIADISPWAVDAVVKLWQAGLLTGDEHGDFKPKSSATRVEAAAFCMRSNEVVKVWASQNQVVPTPSPSPTPTPITENASSGGGGNSGSSDAVTYAITFVTNGGPAIASLQLHKGETMSNLPVPVKQGFIFQGWYKNSDLTRIFADGSTVNENMTLYAKYIESLDDAVQSIPSITVLDQAPSFTIKVDDATGNMTVDQVKAGMKFESPGNPQFAGIEVTGSHGQFIVVAKGGAFEEGNTYQLTLTDAHLSFAGQDPTTTIYVFDIAKQEVVQLPLNHDMVYVPFSDVSNMTENGTDVDSLSIPVITAEVGDSRTSLGSVNVLNGTFDYDGHSVQVGDTVAIYTGVRPDQRTVHTSDAGNGDVAYVEITAKSGNTYTYTHADPEKVLVKPNVLPVSTTADTDGSATNHSITLEHTTMNYSNSKYSPLGLDELTVVKAGDFIAFYNGEFGSGATSAGYGLITSITHAEDMDILTYTDATEEQLENPLNFYQKQTLDGDQLLSNAEVASLEGQIKQQAVASGFVNQAANYLSTAALQTDSFKQQYNALAPMAATNSSKKVSVENLTIIPSIGSQLQHFPGYTGVSVSLQVKCDIVIDSNNDNKDVIIIHLTSTFLEEMHFGLSINGQTQTHKILFVPIIDDYVITANLDAYTYTGITITAEIGTIAKTNLKDALKDWNKINNAVNIAQQIQALLEGVDDSGAISATTLKNKYRSLLKNETEWVPFLSKELVRNRPSVCAGLVQVEFTATLVVSVNPNLTVGADYSYQSAKRYTATVKVYSFTGSSSTLSLQGDGNYQFKFYVLGTIGLRAGLLMELKAGILSVKLNSIGASAEAGIYLKLWGYFYYQLTNTSAGKTADSLGALYLESGVYLVSVVGAQLGGGLLSGDVPLYENEWLLYSAGSQNNADDFAYPQDDSLGFTFVPAATSFQVPDKLFTMNGIDMKTGDATAKVYDPSNFDIQVDNPDFKYNPSTRTIEVANKSNSVSAGNLVITWKNASLAFSASPIKRTLPLYWSSRQGNYTIELELRNGEINRVISAPYDAKIDVQAPVYSGYTFKGWYTALDGGTKYTISNTMPAKDLHLYAHWVPNSNTPYAVEHYLIDPNRGDASLAATENLQGTTNTEINITSNKFALQGYLTGSVSGVYIKGDGTAVARIYYRPADRMMTFKLGYGASSAGSTVSAPIGKDISTQIPVMTRPGYSFAGWSPSVPNAMPSQDATYTATWTARNDTPYKIVYLQQDMGKDQYGYPIGGNTYTIADVELLKGTTDTAINATPKSYEGFSYDSSAPGTLLTSTIAADGTTVLKMYYKRNQYLATFDPNGGTLVGGYTNPINKTIYYGQNMNIWTPAVTNGNAVFMGWSPSIPATMPGHNVTFTSQWKQGSYTVDHIRQDLTGAYTITESETIVAPANNTVTGTPKSYEGFTYNSGMSGTIASGVVGDSTNSPLHLKLYYARNSYKVTFDANGGTGGTTINVVYGASTFIVSAPQVTKAGNVFKEWSPLLSAMPETMPAQDIAYTAQWKAGPSVNYAGIILQASYKVGDTLTATATISDGNPVGNRAAYQWQVETNVGSGTYQNASGSGSTTASYTIAMADMGKKLRVAVTGAEEATGTETSIATSAVLIPVSGVTINIVNPIVGDTLAANVTMGDGNAAGSRVNYQWKVETTADSGTYQDAAGTGSQTATYTVAEADSGKKLQVVVTGAAGASGTATSAATSAVPVGVAGVTIDNIYPTIDAILTASATMQDGNVAGNRVIYQWKVESAAGSGTYQNATGTGNATASYTVAADDMGKKLQVVVMGVSPATGTKTATTSTVIDSIYITGVTIPNVNPGVGWRGVNSGVYARVSMSDGNPTEGRVSFQWQVETETGSGTYQNATGEVFESQGAGFYRPVAGDIGKKLKVIVTGLGPVAGTKTTVTNAVIAGFDNYPIIDNTNPRIGDTLHADVLMADGNPPGDRVTYQWYTEDLLPGDYIPAKGVDATTASYTVKAADGGKRLKVTVTVDADYGALGSAATNAVKLISDNIIPTWIAVAQSAGLTNLTQVSNTVVSMSGPATLTGNLTIPEGVTLIVSDPFVVAAGTKLTIEGTLKVHNHPSFANNGTIVMENNSYFIQFGEDFTEELSEAINEWIDNGTFIINGDGTLVIVPREL
ncbi:MULTISPECIES: InlB B-repeat-containing protein [unclassified Paenibacillus]|uniref:InlB B-repeat-containing protein n=1 Tax=unclassified Paenibacillus TaxID=185978 RepID=UPI0013563CAB|nr:MULTISPECIES: InlB B-repeat-containing protein [unclassified Paenibacillus]ASS67580.2 hypothetical protein CIC07_16560 [Paenibacillus sp. RUD330]